MYYRDLPYKGPELIDFVLVATLIISSVLIYTNYQETKNRPTPEYACMNGVKYQVKNIIEYHIVLKKGYAISCSESPSDPLK